MAMICKETSYEKLFDQVEDGVDPRVQVELEKLNASTNEINKLEVDLDDARNQFRRLLQESTGLIDNCAKKLGSSIVKVRPYYDARMQAKEALEEAQKAAVNFEKASSAHAAAKEMVYLAEEGLKTEGRIFDHAWQEMLNHATMRVNESESERTKCEAEHKKSFQYYQLSEIRVITLQKELKRAIAKSRPYFELKIHCNQLLEKQKIKIKSLEKQVADVKLEYALALKNLERISDEIHKNRQKSKCSKATDLRGASTGADAQLNIITQWMSHDSRTPDNGNKLVETDAGYDANGRCFSQEKLKISGGKWKATPTDCQMQAVADVWSPVADPTGRFKASPDSNSEYESSRAGPPDAKSDEGTLKFSSKTQHVAGSLITRNPKNIIVDGTETENSDFGADHVNAEQHRFYAETRNEDFELAGEVGDGGDSNSDGSAWTEINLRSPLNETFSEVEFFRLMSRNKAEVGKFDGVPSPLADLVENFPDLCEQEKKGSPEAAEGSDLRNHEKFHSPNVIPSGTNGEEIAPKGSEETPRKLRLRRQSLDILWNSTASEKVKGIISQSIMKFNKSTSCEKKTNESRCDGKILPPQTPKNSPRNEHLTFDPRCESGQQTRSPFPSFYKRTLQIDDDAKLSNLNGKSKNVGQESPAMGALVFASKKEKFFTKKIPGPLEKTFNYLNNADEESNSDSESLASSDVLTDEQLSSLVLDRDLTDIYQDVI